MTNRNIYKADCLISGYYFENVLGISTRFRELDTSNFRLDLPKRENVMIKAWWYPEVWLTYFHWSDDWTNMLRCSMLTIDIVPGEAVHKYYAVFIILCALRSFTRELWPLQLTLRKVKESNRIKQDQMRLDMAIMSVIYCALPNVGRLWCVQWRQQFVILLFLISQRDHSTGLSND